MKVKIINKSQHPLPQYATPYSAGMDLRANLSEPVVIKPLERKLIPTGVYIALPEGFEAQIRPRSGLALKHEYAEWQKQQANEIIEEQRLIETKQQVLGQRRTEKNQLLNVREDETRKLENQKASQKVEVKQLNKKQKELIVQLRKNQRRAEDLNRQIENQIAAEIARAEAEAKAARERAEKLERDRAALAKSTGKTAPEKVAPVREERVADTKGGYAMTREEKQLSDNFAENRGRLPYPVTGRHAIVGFFGEQQHQDLKYVRTNNSGIDIQTDPGANARAVFNGVVTRVFVVPGYNNSIIIRHGRPMLFIRIFGILWVVTVLSFHRECTAIPISLQNFGKPVYDCSKGSRQVVSIILNLCQQNV